MSCGFVDLRPIEVSTSPGVSGTVLSGEYSPLSVSFNTGMEEREAENLLTVSSDLGTVEGDRTWNGNTLQFIPAAGWTAGIRYTMGLSGTARSADGRELRIERGIFFYAMNKSPPPFVERHYPSDGESVRTGTRLELRFSYPMDRISVESSIISGETKDTEGLKIGTDYRRVFVADIPYLRITSVSVYNGDGVDPAENSVLQIPVSEVDGGLIRFTIKFSQMFNEEAKQKTALSVSLVPFFPSSLDYIALRFVSWLSDDTLNMEWERLKAGTPDEPHYYRLLIPGGRNGIDNGGGIYLEQEISLYLEAVK